MNWFNDDIRWYDEKRGIGDKKLSRKIDKKKFSFRLIE